MRAAEKYAEVGEDRPQCWCEECQGKPRLWSASNVHVGGGFWCCPTKAKERSKRHKAKVGSLYRRKAYANARQKREQLKREAGGACVRCGYNKCLDALHWHHKDPQQKSFGLAAHYQRSLVGLRKEIAKCELICANCHAELHFMKS